MNNIIPFVNLEILHQPIQGKINQAVQQVMTKGDFILGEAVAQFELDFATNCGVKYGVGVACGTDAIALGLMACGVKSGDEIILPVNTFVATLMGIIRTGATPIFADCDRTTGLIDFHSIESKITDRTKAIVPVHLYGQMVDPQRLLNLAKKHNLLIFEDASQAHLAERGNYRAGSVGIAAAFSFYPSKNLGAFGDAGMIVTNHQQIAQKVITLRNYGAPQKYLHTEIGMNSRLDTIQAAILQVKLPYLKKWNADRLQAAQLYDKLLKPLLDRGIVPIANISNNGHVYHLYVIKVTEKCPIQRDRLQKALTSQRIQTGIHYPLPCHLQPAYRHLGYQKGDFPQAETLSQQILSLPIYPGITDQQIAQVVNCLSAAISE